MDDLLFDKLIDEGATIVIKTIIKGEDGDARQMWRDVLAPHGMTVEEFDKEVSRRIEMELGNTDG